MTSETIPKPRSEVGLVTIGLLQVQWESLRTESREAIERRVLLINWGTTAYGALASAAAWLFAAGHNDPAAFWFLCLALPFQALVVTALWAGEARRGSRAGKYMCLVEQDVDDLLKMLAAGNEDVLHTWLLTRRDRQFGSLSWESDLRVTRGHERGWWKTSQMEFPYFVVFLYLLGMVLAPLGTAWWLASVRWHQPFHPAPLSMAILAVTTLLAIGFWLKAAEPPKEVPTDHEGRRE